MSFTRSLNPLTTDGQPRTFLNQAVAGDTFYIQSGEAGTRWVLTTFILNCELVGGQAQLQVALNGFPILTTIYNAGTPFTIAPTQIAFGGFEVVLLPTDQIQLNVIDGSPDVSSVGWFYISGYVQGLQETFA